jgi:hypothetical protein
LPVRAARQIEPSVNALYKIPELRHGFLAVLSIFFTSLAARASAPGNFRWQFRQQVI